MKEEWKAQRERNDGGEAGRGEHGVREGVDEERRQGGGDMKGEAGAWGRAWGEGGIAGGREGMEGIH